MRKGKATARILAPDAQYGDPLVTRFINGLMHEGKKSKACAIFYKAMELIKEKSGEEGIEVWRKALRNVTPVVETKSRRIRGANYQVPIEVTPRRKVALAIRWVIGSARKRSGEDMATRLAKELIAAAHEEGNAYKKKNDGEKMAKAQRAYSHFKF